MRHGMLQAGRAILIFGLLASRSDAQNPGETDAGATIPFALVSHFLVVVNGQIGDQDHLKFIVDTGATRSVIDQKLAERLHLQPSAGEVLSFERSLPAQSAVIPELAVGPLRAREMRVLVVKLAEYSRLAQKVDGIIGLDLLSRSRKFTIDYGKRTLSFWVADAGRNEPLHPQCLLVPFVVQGSSFHLAVDTGFQGILVYGDRLRERLPDVRTEGESLPATMGRIRATQVRLPGVRIARSETVATVLLMDGPDEVTLPGVDGYLGPAALHAKRIEFDFADNALRWQ